jgi:hypothetical protein
MIKWIFALGLVGIGIVSGVCWEDFRWEGSRWEDFRWDDSSWDDSSWDIPRDVPTIARENPTTTIPQWGFYAHEKINFYACFLLPPKLLAFYKPHIHWIASHATDPDKRRYLVPEEGPRHFIDIDLYGTYPYPELPRRYDSAVARFGHDTVHERGIVPWHLQTMQRRLTEAFRAKDLASILKNSAELGHYMADAHVPLHACSNHNGQHTGQDGIHGLWESRIPELVLESEFQFFLEPAAYLPRFGPFVWERVLESARAADTVLLLEKQLTQRMRASRKFAYSFRKGRPVRQYSADFALRYHQLLGDMVERRMHAAIWAIASAWFTAWVDAGQPDLTQLRGTISFSDSLDQRWQLVEKMLGRSEGDH